MKHKNAQRKIISLALQALRVWLPRPFGGQFQRPRLLPQEGVRKGWGWEDVPSPVRGLSLIIVEDSWVVSACVDPQSTHRLLWSS